MRWDSWERRSVSSNDLVWPRGSEQKSSRLVETRSAQPPGRASFRGSKCDTPAADRLGWNQWGAAYLGRAEEMLPRHRSGGEMRCWSVERGEWKAKVSKEAGGAVVEGRNDRPERQPAARFPNASCLNTGKRASNRRRAVMVSATKIH